MSYVAPNPEQLESDKLFDNGQCARLPQVKANMPHTSNWKQGEKVQGNKNITPGTVIANFLNGKYPNMSGYHAAIYLSQDEKGRWVIDQWVSRGKVGKRLIKFKGGKGRASNDGDQYYVVE